MNVKNRELYIKLLSVLNAYEYAIYVKLHILKEPNKDSITLSMQEIADVVKCSVNTVRKNIYLLELKGYIKIERNGKKHTYVFTNKGWE